MGTVKKQNYLPIEDYLKEEERSNARHEYVNGLIYAMVGGTARHNLITTAVTSTLKQHLKGKPCHVFMSDMKVRVNDVFYYPDVMVVCGPMDMKSLYQTEPTLIVEVLSVSTEAKDRLEKLVAYQSLQSVQEYVLLAQDKVKVEIYRRDKNEWNIESLSYGDTINLTSVGYTGSVEMFYEDVIGASNE